MGKIKVKRKSTLIDMTAMSDVTVLLLTFFMLTSTFLQKEPIQTIAPPSVSEELVPVERLAQVLIATADDLTDANGKVLRKGDVKAYITLTGEASDSTKNEWGSAALRGKVLREAVRRYEEYTGKKLEIFTGSELQDSLTMAKFAEINAFGVPFATLKEYLDSDPATRDAIAAQINSAKSGIPVAPMQKNESFVDAMSAKGEPIAIWNRSGDFSFVDTNNEPRSEFQVWMESIRAVAQENPEFSEKIKKTGEGIAVKADRYTPFSKVNQVLEALRTIKLNKFTVLTTLKLPEQ